MSKKKRRIPMTVRADVMERDHRRCRMCGTPDNLSLHHVVYRSEGGPSVLSNLLTLCKPCHRRVHGNRKRFEPICVALLTADPSVHLALVDLIDHP